MKEYPSIDNIIRYDLPIIATSKIDGSNIRGGWNNKRGFYKFGTRHQMIDESSPFGKAIPLIRDKYEKDLTSIFKEQGWRDVICFFEFYGPNSFAGQHVDAEEQTVILFDINPLRKGILEPKKFVELFGHLDIPKVVFEGYITSELVSLIRNSQLDNLSHEGVVCKGFEDNKTVMFKIKTQAWLDRLKERCHGDENIFQKLA